MAEIHRKKCRLLALPAELRNKIYTEAIVNLNTTLIDSTGYDRSALLTTCKKIRSETLGIYYSDNSFSITLPQYSPRHIIAWQETTRPIILKGVHIHLEPILSDPTPHWANFVEWMHFMHQDGSGFSPLPKATNAELESLPTASLVARNMMYMVTRMRSQPWDFMKDLLEEQRFVLGKLDKRWMRDW